MSSSFGLKSRVQFQDLDQRRDQWVSVKNQPDPQVRLKELISMWARQDCALDDLENPGLWNVDILDENRALQSDNHSRAAGRLIFLVQSKRALGLQDLLELHGLMISGNPQEGTFRNSWIKPLADQHQPVESELLPELVANALEWFGSGSFNEIHEVEQDALFLIKLLDLLPFPHANGRTLRLAANFFLLRAGFPPAVIPASKTDQYHSAIGNALKMDTQPLVDLLAESALESLCYCLGEAARTSPFQILP